MSHWPRCLFIVHRNPLLQNFNIKKKNGTGSKISLYVFNNYLPHQKLFHTEVVYLDICTVCYVQMFVVGEMIFRKRKIMM